MADEVTLADRMRQAFQDAVIAEQEPIEWRVHPGLSNHLLNAADREGTLLIKGPPRGDLTFLGLPLITEPGFADETDFRLVCA